MAQMMFGFVMHKFNAPFSQMRPVTMGNPTGLRMPMYPPGGQGVGQPLFYGQGPPVMLPPQAGFGYQQQLVPGMRPCVRSGARRFRQSPNIYRKLVFID